MKGFIMNWALALRRLNRKFFPKIEGSLHFSVYTERLNPFQAWIIDELLKFPRFTPLTWPNSRLISQLSFLVRWHHYRPIYTVRRYRSTVEWKICLKKGLFPCIRNIFTQPIFRLQINLSHWNHSTFSFI